MHNSRRLERFVEAQNPVYEQVCTELKQGRKTTHWMWFVFPQVLGLGRTSKAKKFAISSLKEAQDYLHHPVLGRRLKECTLLAISIKETSALDIFGYPDNLKFCSSMTLFSHATVDNDYFRKALKKYFNGEEDQLTIERI